MNLENFLLQGALANNSTNSKEINRFSEDANTCENGSYPNLFRGFNIQTKDTYFFSAIIQFILVSLMYIHVGNGKYWKVLFFAATAGLIGSAIENTTIAYICLEENRPISAKGTFTFFVEEFFWIVSEYSIPYLNLIKMEAISNGRYVKAIKIIIYLLGFPFGVARIINGYDRMMKGYLNTELSRLCLGIAFGIMAVANIICTISIIYLVKRKVKQGTFRNTSISSYIKNSTYTILICVDMVSLSLSVLYIFSVLIFPSNKDLESSAYIFHCLKSVFILILATDAIIFKYGASNNTYALHDINSRLNQYDYYLKKTLHNNNNKTFVIDINNDNRSSASKASYSSYKFPASLASARAYSNSHSPTLDGNKNNSNKKFGGIFHPTDLTDYMYNNKE